MGNKIIPGLNTWKPNDNERDCKCVGCDVTLVSELVADMGQNTYAFMKQAVGETTVTVTEKFGAGVGPIGPTVNAGVERSVSTVKDEWLISYMRKEGSNYRCTDCFRNDFPVDFRGVLLTSTGKAKVISSKCEWGK